MTPDPPPVSGRSVSRTGGWVVGPRGKVETLRRKVPGCNEVAARVPSGYCGGMSSPSPSVEGGGVGPVWGRWVSG